MTRILGVDPGLASFGWALIEAHGTRLALVDHGTLTTAPADGDPFDRVGRLADGFAVVLTGHQLPAVATEAWVHYGDHPTTQAHALGLVLGMVRTTCQRFGVRHVVGDRAQGWRVALGLARTATKAAAQARVRAVLGLSRPLTQHASDAAAVAIVAAMRGGRV